MSPHRHGLIARPGAAVEWAPAEVALDTALETTAAPASREATGSRANTPGPAYVQEMLRRFLPALAIAATLATLGFRARADIVNPNTKRVDYAFVVDNAAAYPDLVVLAYPWSLSNGVPYREYTAVGGDPVHVGRWHEPHLYVVEKADYDRLTASAGEAGPSLHGADDFFKNPAVVDANVGVSPLRTVPSSSNLATAEDHLKIIRCDDSSIELRLTRADYTFSDGTSKSIAWGADGKRPDPSGAASAPPAVDAPCGASKAKLPAPLAATDGMTSTGGGDAAAPAAADDGGLAPAPTSTAAPASSTAPAPAPRGCGGCTTSGASMSSPFLGGVIAAASLALARARRRARRRRS